MYFVYILKSTKFPNCTYVGFTTNIQERLRIHNSGGSFHTAKYRPWELLNYLAFQDKSKAMLFEKYLKSHAGKAFGNKRLW